jgi:nuclear protein localization family protein 4
MLLRFSTPIGQLRVEFTNWNEISQKLAGTTCSILSIDYLKTTQFYLSNAPNGPQIDTPMNIKHGDLFYVVVNSSANTSKPTVIKETSQIDLLLEKDKGLIARGRQSLCKHSALAMCEHCLPLSPWDASYLEQNKIKFMSFHAYLRSVMDANKTAPLHSPQFIHPLDEHDFTVKKCPSKTHEPYPLGICSKCQPSAISLQSQTFRMVDHVEFESASMVILRKCLF